MFEYMMPSIWMRSYPDTLVSRTLGGVVAIQRAFGKGAWDSLGNLRVRLGG